MKSIALLLFLLALAACSSTPDPLPRVTLAVENTTCDTACATIQVVAFPTRQPATPGGPWNFTLGALSTRYGCFEFPLTEQFTVSSTDPATSPKFTWSVRDSVALGTLGADSQSFFAYRSPSTSTFVPAAATGWSVKLPSGKTLVTGGACTS